VPRWTAADSTLARFSIPCSLPCVQIYREFREHDILVREHTLDILRHMLACLQVRVGSQRPYIPFHTSPPVQNFAALPIVLVCFLQSTIVVWNLFGASMHHNLPIALCSRLVDLNIWLVPF